MIRQSTNGRMSPTRDIGHTGLEHEGGYLLDDFLSEWRGPEKVRRIEEMLKNSPVVGALRLAIEMPIRDIEWQVTSEEENDARLQLVNDALGSTSHSWNDHVIDALLAVFYGWSMFTVTYQRVGGRVLWRKFKMLGHNTIERWLIADDGGIQGVQQHRHLWPEPIPIERMLLYRLRKTQNNPEGESLLRPAYVPWYYLKNIQSVEAIGIERNLAGLPIITPPMGADMSDGSTDKRRAETILRNVRNDDAAGILLPSPVGEGDHMRWHFDLLSAAGGSKVMDTDKVIARYEKRMLMSSLAQFLMLGMDNIGAMATFDGATDFFTMSVNAIADMIAETFTKYAIPRLLKLNGKDADSIRLEHSPAGDIDLSVISTFLQQTGSLITWTPEDEVWLRSLARLPQKAVDDLEQLREEERERREAMARAIRQGGNDDEDRDDHGLQFGIEEERESLERRWQSRAAKYFTEQKKALLRAVGDGEPV